MQVLNPIDLNVGACLRNLRFKRGWSVNRLAKAVAVSSASILEFESGVTRVDAHILVEICAALDVQPSYFFGWLPQDAAVEAVTWCKTNVA
jgi:transcriptional regulator with XRE-family HTH domain